jgi:cytochrome b
VSETKPNLAILEPTGNHYSRLWASILESLGVLEQSGDELVEKASGSALCRMALWQYVLCQVETGKLKPNSVTKRLLDYKNSLKNLTTPQGKQLLNGKHLQGKLMAKVANMLFDELVKALAQGTIN